ncbi:hypothetical protein ONS96_014366 [Cadophora gregata f. sp. sojae]|nr:hypothetical protein ONS96_014366 [Cadophora gregata f. sp. sojae]
MARGKGHLRPCYHTTLAIISTMYGIMKATSAVISRLNGSTLRFGRHWAGRWEVYKKTLSAAFPTGYCTHHLHISVRLQPQTTIKMRLTQILLPITFLVSHVAADGASISAAIDNIGAAAGKLNETVADFPNNPILGLTDIGDLLVNSVGVLKTINEGTKVAEASAQLTTLEAFGLAGKIQSLSSSVTSTLDTTVAAKKKFDKLLIVSPIVLLNLKQQKSATVEFGDAVTAKVPAELQEIAKNLQAPILAAFDKAIDAYNPF